MSKTNLEKIINARQIMGEFVEASQGLKDPDDQLTVLKTGYQLAIKYAPDPTKRKYPLKMINIDDYKAKLDSQLVQSSYLLARHYTKKLEIQNKRLLHKQKVFIEFQRYNLSHGRSYIDDIVLLNSKQEIVKITADQYLSYIKPYRKYLQSEIAKLRPNIDIKD